MKGIAMVSLAALVACGARAAAQEAEDAPEKAVISVYAIEPRPLGPESPGSRVPYEAGMRVVNAGGEPAQVERADVAFEVWTEDGHHEPCALERESDSLEAPPVLQPGEAIDMTAVAMCPLPPGREDAVQSRVTFQASDPRAGLELEREYVAERVVPPTSVAG